MFQYLKIFVAWFVILVVGCTSASKKDGANGDSTIDPANAITVETSGDLYEDPLNQGFSLQFSGRCENKNASVVVAANGKKTEVPCTENSYSYKHLIPKSGLGSENTFWLTKLNFYHPDKEASKAQSWILFDAAKGTLKTILNQQYRFETTPGGQLKPILEVTSLGYCSGRNKVTMKIGGVNEFQQPFDKFKVDKNCQNGRYYFLTQTEERDWINLQLRIKEEFTPQVSKAAPEIDIRAPASEIESAPPAKKPVVFDWSVELSTD